MPTLPKTSPRKSPRQARSEATVEAILEATARVLTRDGYDHLSTNRVALQAGVSIGSLYQYFPSKEALVAALIDRHREMMMSVFFRRMSEVSGAPCAVAARVLVRALVEAHAADPKLHRTLHEQVPSVGRLGHLLDDIEVRAAGAVRAYLDAHRDELRIEDIETATFVVVHAVEAITHAAVLTRPKGISIDRFIEETTDMVVSYLTKPDAR
jgi:AcrR family transcriptional regulator